MKYPEMPICPHLDCAHMQRLEYCEVEAKYPDGDAAVCIDIIESLLYDRGDFETGMSYSVDNELRYITRNFEYLHGDTDSWVWPLLETRVSIQHTQNRRMQNDSYSVRIGWRSHQVGTGEELYETVYTLEEWPGLVHSTIDEYDLSAEQLINKDVPVHHSRPMTAYDHESLFYSLSILEDMRIGQGYESIG